MRIRYDLYVVLGCGGKIINNFVLCNKTENIVVDLSLDNIDNNIVSFIDNACNLFNRPLTDTNAIVNTLNLLNTRFSIFDENMWSLIQMWIIQHKRCGIYLRLYLKDEYEKIDFDDKFVFVQSNKD